MKNPLQRERPKPKPEPPLTDREWHQLRFEALRKRIDEHEAMIVGRLNGFLQLIQTGLDRIGQLSTQQTETINNTKGIEMKVSELPGIISGIQAGVTEIKGLADATKSNVEKVGAEVQKVLDSIRDSDPDLSSETTALIEGLQASVGAAKESATATSAAVKVVDDKIPDPAEPVTP